MNGGELFTHLNKRQHFSEQDAKIYIAELALALGQLHNVRQEAVLLQGGYSSWRVSRLARHYLPRYQTREYSTG